MAPRGVERDPGRFCADRRGGAVALSLGAGNSCQRASHGIERECSAARPPGHEDLSERAVPFRLYS